MSNDLKQKAAQEAIPEKEMAVPAIFQIVPTTLDECMDYAKLIAESDLVPNDFRRKPGNCLVAMQMGAEVGLKPLQAIQGIAIINGRPCIWGDALLGIVQNSPKYEWHTEEMDPKGEWATCTVKRRGNPKAHTVRFSKADAEKAKLWTKQGPWTNYPKRMLQLRARAFALRDAFSDVLKGLEVVEEVSDLARGSIETTDTYQTPERVSNDAPTEDGPPEQALKTSPEKEAPKTGQVAVEITEVKKWTEGKLEYFEIKESEGCVYRTNDDKWAKTAKTKIGKGPVTITYRKEYDLLVLLSIN